MIDAGQAAPGARGRRQVVTLRPRSPVRAAILSAVTLTLYGFWWWELNRELHARGEATNPWRALAAVTLGWAVTAAGLVLFATSIVFPPGFFLFGWIPPAFGMALVWYEQRQFNQATGTGAVRWPRPSLRPQQR